jgi:DNA excision repair protein ERCC-2
MESLLFPHDSVRPQQDTFITKVLETIDRKGQLVVHAPTGLGKTAAALAPTIERAIKLNKVVIFMTSRLTQHALALETVSRIRQKHNVSINVVDLIGKKHMCLQPGVERLGGKEFAEYCKAVREDGLCEHYTRMKNGEQLSSHAKSVLVQLGKKAPNTPENVKAMCEEEEYRVCPYEITMLMAKDARVIITDYSYIFNERIRDGFFKRINRELQDCILVIDEGHNLPERIKELATERVSTNVIRRAMRELEKLQQEDHKHHLQLMAEALAKLGEAMKDEKHVTRDAFLSEIKRICDINMLIEDLNTAADQVREEQKSSSCGTVADFLEAWAGDDDGFTRILARKDDRFEKDEGPKEEQHALFGARRIDMPSASRLPSLELRYRCLDPGVITKPVLDDAYSTIIMSGTLMPTAMYAQVLGTTDPELLTLPSPFPHENRLNIIIPKTTTKFTTRSAQMFEDMALICAQVVNTVPGNIAIFFPSYMLLEEVKKHLDTKSHKTVFTEHPSFTKEEREGLLGRFKQYKHDGAVLLGVMGGSFSEGIDLPGDELRTVIIVGLPLGRPDLETKALIDYYDQKFGRGWDYGYTFPAFNKTLQSAGRCIRTETDRGAIIFLDERYAWQSYYQCFPKEWRIKISLKYEDLLKDFFKG